MPGATQVCAAPRRSRRGWSRRAIAALRIRGLATLRRDTPGMALGADALVWRGPDRERSRDLFERLGWKGIARRVATLACESIAQIRQGG